MRYISRLTVVTVLCCGSIVAAADKPPYWPCTANGDEPFGHFSDSEVEQLSEFASTHDVDLQATLEKVASGDRDALETVLRLSAEFGELGVPARLYGNLLVAIFLNLGEANGPDYFIGTMTSLKPVLQQRIRDFLWYPIFCIPDENRGHIESEYRKEFPRLWPADYVFGKDDPLFR